MLGIRFIFILFLASIPLFYILKYFFSKREKRPGDNEIESLVNKLVRKYTKYKIHPLIIILVSFIYNKIYNEITLHFSIR